MKPNHLFDVKTKYNGHFIGVVTGQSLKTLQSTHCQQCQKASNQHDFHSFCLCSLVFVCHVHFLHVKFLSFNCQMIQVNYEAYGQVVHHKSDIWAKTSADQGDVVYALWPMGGAWLCIHLWEHYAYTMGEVNFMTFPKFYVLFLFCPNLNLAFQVWLI